MPGIPTKEEFFLPYRNPNAACPDAQWAWKNFGGKTLEEAYALFCSNPDHHQEAFMFMPEGGFRFYFPVVDRYLRNVGPLEGENCSGPAGILASCIQAHFDIHENMSGLHEPILTLCDYVCTHALHWESEIKEQDKLRAVWTDLRQQVVADTQGTRLPRK